MTSMLDLRPAANQLIRLLAGLTDDQLTLPTPCERSSVADLVDHVSGLTRAFTAAAAKDLGPLTAQAPVPDGARLGPDWRDRVAGELRALTQAWRPPTAWTGMTQAGGVDLPAATAGTVVLDELVLHGWDIARASGQPFRCDPNDATASLGFVSFFSSPEQAAGRAGLFGPVVPVPDDAPPFDRLLGLSGRDPSWAPAGATGRSDTVTSSSSG